VILQGFEPSSAHQGSSSAASLWGILEPQSASLSFGGVAAALHSLWVGDGERRKQIVDISVPSP
jgi:hypothetical protein